ncbi:MAG TPA: STAS domain-containing protein [Micromonosporaceae bacterium]|nr:STAS domain-containing protein [Micromonosporaceae bacterium]
MTAELRVAVRDSTGDATVVSVHGNILFDTSQPLMEALLVLVEAERPHIVVDLADVPLCDSTGLRVLLQAHGRATANAGWLRLGAVQPLVADILAITNLTRVLPVYGSVEAAAAGEVAGDGRP